MAVATRVTKKREKPDRTATTKKKPATRTRKVAAGPAPEPVARYAVTFEDAVIPEERAVGLASSRVTVVDTQTNEVLGEMDRYVFHPGVGQGPSGSWQIADKCPGVLFGSGQATRQFVDHVLVARGATLPPPLK